MTDRPNLSTFLLVAAIFTAFAVAQHLDMTDHSAEHAQAAEIEQRLSEAEQQHRRDTAAQFACGHQAHYEWVNATTIECFTKRGKPAGNAEVAAK